MNAGFAIAAALACGALLSPAFGGIPKRNCDIVPPQQEEPADEDAVAELVALHRAAAGREFDLALAAGTPSAPERSCFRAGEPDGDRNVSVLPQAPYRRR